MCGGGGAPPPPAPDPAETELRQKQIALLEDQSRQQNLFQGLQADQYGYTPTYKTPTADEARLLHPDIAAQIDSLYAKRLQTNKDSVYTGITNQIKALETQLVAPTISGYEKTADRAAQDKQLADLQTQQLETSKRSNQAINDYLDSLQSPEYKAAQAKQAQLDAQQQDIALQQGERQKLALEGNLPVSQGTTDRKTQEFAALKESLARSGNNIIGDDPSTAYSLSSPGSQALDLFNRRYKAVEDQERRGELDSGSQAYLQSVGLAGDIGNKALSTATSFYNPGGYAATSPSLIKGSPVTNNASLVQGYGTAMQPYQQDRQMAWQTGQNNAQIDAQNQAGWLSLAGNLAGAGTSAAFLLSTKKAKKKIVREGLKDERNAMKSLSNTPVYNWKYKHEPDDVKSHVGTLTEEAPPEIVSSDGKSLDVASYFGLLTHGVKNIDRRLAVLEGR